MVGKKAMTIAENVALNGGAIVTDEKDDNPNTAKSVPTFIYIPSTIMQSLLNSTNYDQILILKERNFNRQDRENLKENITSTKNSKKK